MSLALDLFVQAFGCSRTPRSMPYQNGAKAALQRIFEGAPTPEGMPSAVPFSPGSPEFDAYLSGRQEGHQIAADFLKTCSAWGVPA